MKTKENSSSSDLRCPVRGGVDNNTPDSIVTPAETGTVVRYKERKKETEDYFQN